MADKIFVYGDRDYPEDAKNENGNYQHSCAACHERFTGDKARIICKMCNEGKTPRIKVEENPLACSVKDCTSGQLGQWKPVLLIPKTNQPPARMLLDVRVCSVCRARASEALLAKARTQSERLALAFTATGRTPPESFDGITLVYVRATSSEARLADKLKARGFAR